jgi:hypothetical protein
VQIIKNPDLMKTPIDLKLLGLALSTALLITSCNSDDTDGQDGQLRLSATATYLTSASSKTETAAKAINEDLEISKFLINLAEFELELDDDSYETSEDDMYEGEDEWDDDGYYDYEDEIELEGPFELNLLDGQITFINTDVPNGTYEELEFEFEDSEDPQSELFGKSILIQGTIQGTPFEFWHDFEDELEVDFEDTSLDITIKGEAENLVIDFDLSMLFNHALGIDLSQAQDGNGDGLIEISPSDPDGNNELAGEIKEGIKQVIDLLED